MERPKDAPNKARKNAPHTRNERPNINNAATSVATVSTR